METNYYIFSTYQLTCNHPLDYCLLFYDMYGKSCLFSCGLSSVQLAVCSDIAILRICLVAWLSLDALPSLPVLLSFLQGLMLVALFSVVLPISFVSSWWKGSVFFVLPWLPIEIGKQGIHRCNHTGTHSFVASFSIEF